MFKRVENRLYALVTIADELIVWRFNDTVTKCREKFPISCSVVVPQTRPDLF